MVFRKPYAFLIKNFKKIHILLLVLWVFTYYKIYGLKSFIKEYITYGTYNKNLEGISTKIGPLLYLSLIAIIIISILLLLLLLNKKKPWKLYLIIIIEYTFMIYACLATSSYFNALSNIDNVSGVYIYRDLINISSWVQYLVLVILILRITGIDIKKFGFNNDKEFLELNSSDREEFEISVEIDKHSFKRKYNLIKRNIMYFYQEHKLICNIFLTISIGAIIIYTGYYFGVKTRSYKIGDKFTAGIYDITVNSIYVTDSNARGNIIEKNNKFVIINVTMKNNSNKDVTPNFGRFHLMNGSINRTNTIYYDEYFKDIGRGLSSDSIVKSKEEKKFMLVYKVPNDLKNKRFVLYYQEYHGRNDTYLRKIKLKLTDVSKSNKTKNYQIGDKIAFKNLDNTTEYVTFDQYSFNDSITYSKYSCTQGENCQMTTKTLTSDGTYKILKIAFSSSDYEGKEFVDFTSRYAIIKYVDSNGKVHKYNIESALTTYYEGKEMFIKISNDIMESEEIYIDYLIRNKEYIVKIK